MTIYVLSVFDSGCATLWATFDNEEDLHAQLNQILDVSEKEILLEDNYLEIDDMFEFYLEETELNKIEKLH
uniref:hypothetical protein n=1 Tax=Candidatus Enterococcus willemsii TaxID=1857215 RepID=UPI00403F3CEB